MSHWMESSLATKSYIRLEANKKIILFKMYHFTVYKQKHNEQKIAPQYANSGQKNLDI